MAILDQMPLVIEGLVSVKHLGRQNPDGPSRFNDCRVTKSMPKCRLAERTPRLGPLGVACVAVYFNYRLNC